VCVSCGGGGREGGRSTRGRVRSPRWHGGGARREKLKRAKEEQRPLALGAKGILAGVGEGVGEAAQRG
jgi:hypothetical protein